MKASDLNVGDIVTREVWQGSIGTTDYKVVKIDGGRVSLDHRGDTYNYDDCDDWIVVKPAAKKKKPHGKQEYKGNGAHDWERVADSTERLRVPGGWLYRTKTLYGNEHAVAFVPVPEVVGYAV